MHTACVQKVWPQKSWQDLRTVVMSLLHNHRPQPRLWTDGDSVYSDRNFLPMKRKFATEADGEKVCVCVCVWTHESELVASVNYLNTSSNTENQKLPGFFLFWGYFAFIFRTQLSPETWVSFILWPSYLTHTYFIKTHYYTVSSLSSSLPSGVLVRSFAPCRL